MLSRFSSSWASVLTLPYHACITPHCYGGLFSEHHVGEHLLNCTGSPRGIATEGTTEVPEIFRLAGLV
jgi:hypothetical protein